MNVAQPPPAVSSPELLSPAAGMAPKPIDTAPRAIDTRAADFARRGSGRSQHALQMSTLRQMNHQSQRRPPEARATPNPARLLQSAIRRIGLAVGRQRSDPLMHRAARQPAAG